jgi:hypothetical protein
MEIKNRKKEAFQWSRKCENSEIEWIRRKKKIELCYKLQTLEENSEQHFEERERVFVFVWRKRRKKIPCEWLCSKVTN